MTTLSGAIYGRTKGLIPARLRDMLELRHLKSSYLVGTGWLASRKARASVDRHGEPLPWYTYPSIRFLEPRIDASMRVFEFGMGNSTLWWSRRAGDVVAVENHQGWFDKILSSMPANVDASLASETSDDYVQAAARAGGQFDIVVIDGRRRTECARFSLPVLAPGGVFVWDNSNRDRYNDGYQLLLDAGFRRLDFWGIGPLNTYEWCTSIFYRPENCLGL